LEGKGEISQKGGKNKQKEQLNKNFQKKKLGRGPPEKVRKKMELKKFKARLTLETGGDRYGKKDTLVVGNGLGKTI